MASEMSDKERITQLEFQVKGLMETTQKYYETFQLHLYPYIPRPDQYSDPKACRTAGSSIRNIINSPPDTDPAQAQSPPTLPVYTVADIPGLQEYQYTPLDTTNDEIRLLALEVNQTPSDTDAIKCSLEIVSLNELPNLAYTWPPDLRAAFTPLSYCWGLASMTEYIILDEDKSFKVTPSLYNALQHFQQKSFNIYDASGQETQAIKTYWWIDAICVNQKDLGERGSQVGLMSRLYKIAKNVNVWLGQESEDSAVAMSLIRELGYYPEDSVQWGSWNYKSKQPGQTHRPDGPGKPQVKLYPEIQRHSDDQRIKNFSALIKLFQRPWFSRVWIRQEVTLPEDVEFSCGGETCTWKQVLRAAHVLSILIDGYHVPSLQSNGVVRVNGSPKSYFTTAYELLALRQMAHVYKEPTQTILDFRDAQATDPRDKIYATFPLIDPDEVFVRVDYGKDIMAVSRDSAVAILQGKDGLDYLIGCHNPSRNNSQPSWVPDLQGCTFHIYGREDNIYRRSVTNNGWSPPNDTIKLIYHAAESMLDITGVIFDECNNLTHPAKYAPESPNSEIIRVVGEWIDMYNIHKGSRDDMSYHEWDTNLEGVMYISYDNDGSAASSRSDAQFNPKNPIFSYTKEDNMDDDRTLQRVRAMLPVDHRPFSEYFDKQGEYFPVLRRLIVNRKMVVTEQRGFALFPEDSKPGDRVCFFDGCKFPFVIRHVPSEDAWVIVGVAHYFTEIHLHGYRPQLLPQVISII